MTHGMGGELVGTRDLANKNLANTRKEKIRDTIEAEEEGEEKKMPQTCFQVYACKLFKLSGLWSLIGYRRKQ